MPKQNARSPVTRVSLLVIRTAQRTKGEVHKLGLKMSDHWAAGLKAGGTVLRITSARKQLGASRHAGEASVVRVTRGLSRAGYIAVRGSSYGPAGSMVNRVRVFEKPRPGSQQSGNAEISWLEQDTPENRANYEIDAAGASRPQARKRSRDLRAHREEARRAAIHEQALVLYEIVEAVMASDAMVPRTAAARWRVVQQEIAAAMKGAASLPRSKST